MDQIQNNMPMPQEEEIDLVALFKKMWLNKSLIIKLTAVFMVLGVLVALFSSKVYTTSCDVVPQTSKGAMGGGMSSLAALAGINQSDGQSGAELSPLVYHNIMNSTSFRKELMQTKISFEETDRPVSFYEYYTSEEFNKPNVFTYIKKYTIGLPGVILGAIRGEQPEPDYSSLGNASAIETISEDDFKVMNILESCISMNLDNKNGYLTITANMPEALAAAQLAQATVELLQKYITKFKIEKVQSNLDFVQERYDEAKSNFEDVQSRRAKFRDANHNSVKYAARVEQDKLDAEYTLAMNLYSELATQLEQAKINVKETTPILTVIRPVTVPYKKSKPQRVQILAIFTFLGFAVGAGLVFVSQTLAQFIGEERVGKYIKELPAEE